ncbi:MAG: SMC-Scp complex subunit ScpB [Bacillota bacterium]|nr:SMC-Scp complex subunit ScpB [Bacillota bacterium]
MQAGKKTTIMAIIEAALFLSAEPLSLEKLSQICQVSVNEIKDSLNKMKLNLENEERGLVLLETPGGFQLGTRPEAAAFVETLFEEDYFSTPLSQAALETLAIIALKQPVTRVEIEKLRGVQAEGVIENLLKRGLIEIKGRKEGLGRPFLYGITDEFIQYFGLKNPEELENLRKDLDS